MSKKKSQHLIERLLDQEKHRLHVALATEEGEWNQHEPNSGMARIFVIMLLLHVILIGGIVIYDIMDDEAPVAPPSVAMTPTAPTHEEREASLQSEPIEKSTAPDAGSSPEVNPTDYEQYTVKSGDTLPGIAKQLNVELAALVKLNKLDQGMSFDAQTTLLVPREKLPEPKPGEEEAVPAAKPVDPSLFKPSGSIAAGSTIQDAGEPAMPLVEEAPPAVSVEKEAPKAIPMPQLQKSPVVEEAPPAPVVAETPPPAPAPPPKVEVKPKPEPAKTPSASVTTHTLAAGETLYRLSVKYGVSVDALQKANNITDPGRLQIGQKLVIPAK